MAALKILKFDNNTGGLNTRASDMLINPNESPDLLNVRFTKYGAIAKEKGYLHYNNSAIQGSPEIGGIYHYINSATGISKLIVAAGNKLFTASNGTFTNISRLSGDYTSNKIWDFATINNICIGVNGQDEPQKYTGGANAENLGGSPPTGAAIIEIFNNRVFMAGETTNPTKLSFSGIGEPENWDPYNDAGWIEVGLNDGQKITGLKAFFDVLLIFKERSIYALTGYSGDPFSSDYFSVELVNSSIGAVSGKTILNIGNDIYFLSHKGVYTIIGVESYGDLNISNISIKIQSILDELNKSSLNKAFAINDYEDERIWFFVPKGSSSTNNEVLIYDYSLDAWTRRSGFSAKSGLIYYDPVQGINKFYTGSYDGFIYHQKQGYSYAGNKIDAYYTTPWLPLTSPKIRKRIRDIQFYLEATGRHNLGITYTWDFGNSYTGNTNLFIDTGSSFWGKNPNDSYAAIWDVNKWDSASAIKFTKTLNGSGNHIQFKFWNSNPDENFILLGWYITLIERGIR